MFCWVKEKDTNKNNIFDLVTEKCTKCTVKNNIWESIIVKFLLIPFWNINFVQKKSVDNWGNYVTKIIRVHKISFTKVFANTDLYLKTFILNNLISNFAKHKKSFLKYVTRFRRKFFVHMFVTNYKLNFCIVTCYILNHIVINISFLFYLWYI